MVGRFYWYSHELAASQLAYEPRPARKALAQAIAWLVNSPHISQSVRATLKLDLMAAK
jgi:hypothetical protein